MPPQLIQLAHGGQEATAWAGRPAGSKRRHSVVGRLLKGALQPTGVLVGSAGGLIFLAAGTPALSAMVVGGTAFAATATLGIGARKFMTN